MNTAKLNDWLALLANLGIVAGLIIVYLELDHANRLAEANAEQARDAEIVQALKDYALSDSLPEIVIKAAQNGFESLSSVEFSRYQEWEQARLQRLFATYRQYELGFLDRKTVDNSISTAISFGWVDTWEKLGLQDLQNGPFWQEIQRANEAAKKEP